jgi:hypothetical protein
MGDGKVDVRRASLAETKMVAALMLAGEKGVV